MQVKVNGKEQNIKTGQTVRDLLQELNNNQQGVAIAINDEVILRSQWAEHTLQDGDTIDVITAVQGG